MMKFNAKSIRDLADKALRKAEREAQKEAKSVIRTLKADIKRASKKGVKDFRCKVRSDAYDKAKFYFISKGFRCWNYTLDDFKYLAIEW